MQVARRVVERVGDRPVLLAAGGALVFGVVGFLMPLTLFSGSAQLGVVVDDGPGLGVALLIAVILAKVVTFAISMTTGFIGGSIFPMIFIGGTAGMAVHAVIPDIPVALAVTCGMAAVPGAAVALPFTIIAIVAFAATVGPANIAPIGIAVLTSYLIIGGLGITGRAHAGPAEAPADSDDAEPPAQRRRRPPGGQPARVAGRPGAPARPGARPSSRPPGQRGAGPPGRRPPPRGGPPARPGTQPQRPGGPPGRPGPPARPQRPPGPQGPTQPPRRPRPAQPEE